MKIKLRRPGIEPGLTAWKADMLTTIPPTLGIGGLIIKVHSKLNKQLYMIVQARQ
jgi:hypothetical protein